jgi:hypothetical protein
MRLTFLGKETQTGGSPTLFATDRGTYVVQGWKVGGRHDSVEIPQRLVAYLEKGTCLGARLVDSGRGSFTLLVPRSPTPMRCHRWTSRATKLA